MQSEKADSPGRVVFNKVGVIEMMESNKMIQYYLIVPNDGLEQPYKVIDHSDESYKFGEMMSFTFIEDRLDDFQDLQQ